MNPVALVTGGAVRLGRAISLGLAEAGYDLVVAYNSSAEAAAELASSVESTGRRCEIVQGDLGRPADIDILCAAVGETYGRLDLLVNSASTFLPTALLDIEGDEWSEVMNVNLRVPHLLVRGLADLLSECGGSVINIADHMGMKPWVRYAHHSVSKAALIHLTKIQAQGLAPEVRVNAIAPGIVLPPEGMDPLALEREVEGTVLGRAGRPDDVLGAVLYLAEAEFVTGQVVVVDGGASLVD